MRNEENISGEKLENLLDSCVPIEADRISISFAIADYIEARVKVIVKSKEETKKDG